MVKIHFIYSSESSESRDLGKRIEKDIVDSFNQIFIDFEFSFVVSDLYKQQIATEEENQVLIFLLDNVLTNNEDFKVQLNSFMESNDEAVIQKLSLGDLNYSGLHNNITRAFEIKLSSNDDNRLSYWEKVIDLCYDVFSSVNNDKDRRKIYLAETVEKYNNVRLEIKRELVKQGFKVFPNYSYKNVELTNISVDDDLDRCELGVHILGTGNEHEHTVADEINLKCSEYCLTHPNSLKRILWLEENSSDLLESEEFYIESIKRDSRLLHDAEIAQLPIEKLKTLIFSRLTKESNVLEKRTHWDKSLYLIYEQEDAQDANILTSELGQKGYDVVSLKFSQSQEGIFSQHRDYLINAENVLIYHTHKNVKWVSSKIKDLLKSPGYGRKKSFGVKGIYLKDNSVLDKISVSFNNLERFSFGDSFESSDFISALDRVYES